MRARGDSRAARRPPNSPPRAVAGRPGPDRFQIRRGTREDLDLLLEHRHRMWSDIGNRTEAEITEHDRRHRRWLKTRLRSGEVEGYIAELDGRPVGSGCLWWMRDQPRPAYPDTPTAYVMSMFTEPRERGRGLATAILRRMIARARAKGSVRVTLHASEAGRPVYERLGFERSWEMRLLLDPGLAALYRPRGPAPVGSRRRGEGGSGKGPRRSRNPPRGRSAR